MSTQWTYADLASLTDKAVNTLLETDRELIQNLYAQHKAYLAQVDPYANAAVGAYIDRWATKEQEELALQWLQYWLNADNAYCSHCGIVQTTEQYCDGCIAEIMNYLLWEESSKQEQLAECLHMAALDADYHAGKGLY